MDIVKKEKGILDLFRNKNYLKLLIASSVSRFGDALDAIAFGYLVYKITDSALLMGLLFACNAIPNIIFGIHAGIFVDRHYKKIIAVSADMIRGLIVITTVYLLLNGLLETWYLFVVTFINSTVETFASPAKTSIFTRVLDEDDYLTGSSLSKSVNSVADLLGLGLAGGIVVFLGTSGALLVDSATFIVSAIFIFVMKFNDELKNDVVKSNYKDDFNEGYSFIKQNRFIIIIILLFALTNVVLVPFNVFRFMFIEEYLLEEVTLVSGVGIAITIGMILGGLIAAKIGKRFKVNHLVSGGMSSLGFGVFIFGIAPLLLNYRYFMLILIYSVAILMGMGVTISTSALGAHLMKIIPKTMIGRIMAVMNMLLLTVTPVAAAIIGAIGEVIRLDIIFIVCGMIQLTVALSLFFIKGFNTDSEEIVHERKNCIYRNKRHKNAH
ncbi:MFS transporter [Mycoplasmatota bacterium]|nr:MFS transporter [Mycoplasmatota bacterium]